MEGTGEIHMTAEEHAAFIQCYHLLQKLDGANGALLPRSCRRSSLSQENQSNLISTEKRENEQDRLTRFCSFVSILLATSKNYFLVFWARDFVPTKVL